MSLVSASAVILNEAVKNIIQIITTLEEEIVILQNSCQDHSDTEYNRAENEEINMELRGSIEEVGAAMVNVTLLEKHLFTQHGQHLNYIGNWVLYGMIAVDAIVLCLTMIRRPTCVVDQQPGFSSRISTLAKSQMHECHRTRSPTICLQYESLGDF
ncbi:hypothetical protein J6590_048701 [Homalodisca vitripennis]|nr:hypothetical protein J6590_048701 [Homalodisca vitripennis]